MHTLTPIGVNKRILNYKYSSDPMCGKISTSVNGGTYGCVFTCVDTGSGTSIVTSQNFPISRDVQILITDWPVPVNKKSLNIFWLKTDIINSRPYILPCLLCPRVLHTLCLSQSSNIKTESNLEVPLLLYKNHS